MDKSDKAFWVLFITGIFYAFISPCMIFASILFSYTDNMIAARFFMFGMYIGMNALLCAVVGVLSGLHLKTRFYSPFFIAAAVLPLSAKLFGDDPIMMTCAGITFAAGITAMIITAMIKRKIV